MFGKKGFFLGGKGSGDRRAGGGVRERRDFILGEKEGGGTRKTKMGKGRGRGSSFKKKIIFLFNIIFFSFLFV